MSDILRKTLLAALGAADLSKEKIKQTVDYLVEKGKLSKQEAPKIVEDLVTRGEKESNEIKDFVNRFLSGSKSEMSEILKRLDAIEKRLSEIEAK